MIGKGQSAVYRHLKAAIQAPHLEFFTPSSATTCHNFCVSKPTVLRQRHLRLAAEIAARKWDDWLWQKTYVRALIYL